MTATINPSPAPITGTETRSTWKPDPAHTLVEFSAKHMMISTVKGRFTDVDFTLLIDRENLTNSSIEAQLGAASLQSGLDYRDNHLRSADFLDAENNPYITFKSTKIEQEDLDEFKVTGDLTIRGVTHPVTLDVELGGFGVGMQGNEIVGFVAKGQINRKDWGLNWNVALEAGGVLVGEKIKIEIHGEAIKQDAT
jgi:polyisoprenoid-binding protein YceI